MIVCIDGPNFVGKSTIISEVKSKVKNLKIIEDSEIFEVAQNIGDFYEARLILQQKYNLTNNNQNVLICRWFPSMYVFDGRKDFADFVTPDYTFVILSPLDQLLERQKKRNNFKVQMPLAIQLEKFKEAVKVMDCICLQNKDVSDINYISQLIIDAFEKGS